MYREVLLGLNMYEAHNKLDNHMDTLLGGPCWSFSLILILILTLPPRPRHQRVVVPPAGR